MTNAHVHTFRPGSYDPRTRTRRCAECGETVHDDELLIGKSKLTELLAAEVACEEAHAILDEHGIRRETDGGAPMTLADRIGTTLPASPQASPDRIAAFRRDLAELLARHQAEIYEEPRVLSGTATVTIGDQVTSLRELLPR